MKKTLVVIAFLLSGCAILDGSKALKKEMGSYLNHSSKSLIMGYGQPYSKTSDGDGGQIWLYPVNIYEPPQTWYTSGGSVTTPSKNTWLYKMYFVNGSGTVYHYLYKRQDIPPQRFEVTTYQNIRVTTY